MQCNGPCPVNMLVAWCLFRMKSSTIAMHMFAEMEWSTLGHIETQEFSGCRFRHHWQRQSWHYDNARGFRWQRWNWKSPLQPRYCHGSSGNVSVPVNAGSLSILFDIPSAILNKAILSSKMNLENVYLCNEHCAWSWPGTVVFKEVDIINGCRQVIWKACINFARRMLRQEYPWSPLSLPGIYNTGFKFNACSFQVGCQFSSVVLSGACGADVLGKWLLVMMPQSECCECCPRIRHDKCICSIVVNMLSPVSEHK